MTKTSKILPFENCLHNLCYPDGGLSEEVSSAQSEAQVILLNGFRRLGQLLSSLPVRSSGPVHFANRSLIIRGINDLLLAFHAVCVGYYPQAQNLLRPIIESYNLIKLFKNDPTKVDAWCEGGDKGKKALSAGKVRSALYGESQDPLEDLYSFLCEKGSHPRFAGAKSFVLRKDPSQTEDPTIPSFMASIGGKRVPPLHLVNLISCHLMSLILFLSFLEAYPEVFDEEELKGLAEHLEAVLEFGKKYFPGGTAKEEFVKMLEDLGKLAVLEPK